MKPFDYINSINSHERVVIEKGYESFLTNRFFSYFVDTILYANEASGFQNMDKEINYEYYFNTIKPKKRFTKWFKSEKIDNLNMICEYYDCSISKATDILKILTEDQIAELSEWYKVKGE